MMRQIDGASGVDVLVWLPSRPKARLSCRVGGFPRRCGCVGPGSGGWSGGLEGSGGADPGQGGSDQLSCGRGESQLVPTGGAGQACGAADEQAAYGSGAAAGRPDGGEHLQPGGEVVGQQRAPNPHAVDGVRGRGQMVQTGPVRGVTEELLDLGTAPKGPLRRRDLLLQVQLLV